MASHGLDLERGVSRKRKVRHVISSGHPDLDPIKRADADPVPPPLHGSPPPQIQTSGGDDGRKLLAGYLAHEFLTMGTLFGRHWDPAACAVARPAAAKELHRPPPAPLADQSKKQQEERKPTAATATPRGSPPAAADAYAEVVYLLKGDGAGIPAVVDAAGPVDPDVTPAAGPWLP